MTEERRTCSRAGCRQQASTAIDWRNPRIHTGDRSKTWLACEEHVPFLTDFLRARAFPLQVRPVEPVR
ncbi:hypothetical protein [Amnibacterium endophyticum]|uniref:Acetone carboxylase n=1 Tax=Amnibacterium endophyticum TaxID=2109337 RepID=A0ABW4LBW4_9MICO